ncbi:subtilisin-like protease [Rhodotorula toruloides]|uniref:Subtilisin-like protease n=1 Tax=Rhodotorula toruloides TaxID=5286 RepID=A0A511KJC2_RHOTO|nr:subtilisin-like protease [Rhodotorula toruloides]
MTLIDAGTGFNKFHNQGILGSSSIKVGILDTGVDYLILGACFGPGCHFSFGGDYAVDSPGADPYVNCTDHGTHVTGTVGALASPLGFSGVAPNIQIGHYRVFQCSGVVPPRGSRRSLDGRYRVFDCDESTTEDLVVAGILAVANDGVNIVTASIGGLAGWLGASPFQIAVKRREPLENILQSLSHKASRRELRDLGQRSA